MIYKSENFFSLLVGHIRCTHLTTDSSDTAPHPYASESDP